MRYLLHSPPKQPWTHMWHILPWLKVLKQVGDSIISLSPQLHAKLTTLLTIISLSPELRAQLTPQWTFRVIIKVLGKTFGYKLSRLNGLKKPLIYSLVRHVSYSFFYFVIVKIFILTYRIVVGSAWLSKYLVLKQ